MGRPKRPSADHQWCRETREWLSPKEVGQLTKSFYQKAQDTGLQDIEYLDKHGKVREDVLGGKLARSVHIHSVLRDRDDDLNQDLGVFDFHNGVKALRTDIFREEALAAILARRSWSLCGALAMLAAGYTRKEIQRALGIGRPRLARLLSPIETLVAGGGSRSDCP